MLNVHLIYFKPTGKYYSEGLYETKLVNMFEIYDEVEKMKIHPALSYKWDGIILVEVPEHPNNCPKLIIL